MTYEKAHDAAVEVGWLADDDEGGAEGEEGADDQHAAVQEIPHFCFKTYRVQYHKGEFLRQNYCAQSAYDRQ
jgi:hypothetical protein